MRTWLALGAIGCGGGECEALVEGAWTVDGSAFGMLMGVSVSMDQDGCAFTLSDWDMQMTVPSGGTIDGDELTLVGDDAFWETCSGTIAAGGASVEGACEDGSSFTMTAAAAR